MDKVTCIAFILYKFAPNQEVQNMAIDLLNGDVSLRALRKNPALQPQLLMAESILKKNKLDKNEIQKFAETYLLVEA
ncbi:hypothetical protein ACF5W4_09465 [Bacillota bacterium Lsc_1132]